jgi:hypothetical protein
MVNDIKYDEILIAPPFTVVKSPEVTLVVAFSFLVGNTPELRGLSCAVYTGGLCAGQSDHIYCGNRNKSQFIKHVHALAINHNIPERYGLVYDVYSSGYLIVRNKRQVELLHCGM